MKANNIKEKLETILNGENGLDDILDIINTINGYDGSLWDMEYYENDEEFFNTYYNNNPFEAVRASYYGDYHYMDDYVNINTFGNLKSYNNYTLKKELFLCLNEITECIIDLKDESENIKEIYENLIK